MAGELTGKIDATVRLCVQFARQHEQYNGQSKRFQDAASAAISGQWPTP
jgi:hypothetical protein